MRRILTPLSLSIIAFVLFWASMWLWTVTSSLGGTDGVAAYNPIFYPRILIFLGMALTCAVLLHGLWRSETPVGGQDNRAAIIAIGLAGGFMLTLKPFGFFLSSAVFFAAFALAFGYRRPFVVMAAWAATAAFVWIVFTEALKAPLPDWPNFLN